MTIAKPIWKFMFRRHSLRIATFMACAVSAIEDVSNLMSAYTVVRAGSHDAAIRAWFENMRSPNGIMCCSYADGHRTGYDMREG